MNMISPESEPFPLSKVQAEQLQQAHQLAQEKCVPFSWAMLAVTGKVLTATPEEAQAAMEKISVH